MYNEAAILWCTKKQPVTIFSSCKVEYIVESFFISSNLVGFIAEETKMWSAEANEAYDWQQINHKFGQEFNFTREDKHMKTKFHFIREQVIKNMLEVSYCPTEL